MLAYLDGSQEALAAELRPGNAGANTAADQIAVAEAALEQLPAEAAEEAEIVLRTDSAGASHDLLDWCREGKIGFTVGYKLSEAVREAILASPTPTATASRRSSPTGPGMRRRSSAPTAPGRE